MKKKLKSALSLLLCMIMVFGAVAVGGEGIAEAAEYDCLEDMPMISESHYTGNLGDSRVFNLNKQGLPGNYNKYYGNGNIGLDGTTYNNGFEIWVARWNYGDNISWASATFDIGGKYKMLSGKSGIVKGSTNTSSYDTSVYFYNGDSLLYSFRITPDDYEKSFAIDVSGVSSLTLMVKDNKEAAGGTSFALYDLFFDKKYYQSNVGDIITFGSYPQSEVTKESDSATYSKLEAASKNWVSYRYYSGDGSYGSMKQGDWMEYADISLSGVKYRAVRFTQYRPFRTEFPSLYPNSYQGKNGYTVNNIYYFKYEPLKWRVLDPETGLVLGESIIDSQAYSNTIYSNSKGYTNDAAGTTYANDYVTSSIRKWLNEDFYNTAFTSSQQANIRPTTLDNSAWSTSSSEYDSVSVTDKVFLLSYSEVQNAFYGFTNSTVSTDTRTAMGTDYAKAQGLLVNSASKCSGWRLRSAGSDSDRVCRVNIDGYIYDSGYVFATSSGIRPALRLSNLASDIFESALSKVKSDEYAVFVTDADGNLLSGAEVTWNSEKATTAADGMAIFKKFTVGEPRITVTKSGYIKYDNKNTNYSKSSCGFDVVTLYREGSEEAYKLTNARYINGITSQDILVRTKRLSLSNKNETFGISCSAATSAGVAYYELMQGTKVIAKSNDGEFSSLKIGSFKKGDEIKAATILTTGKSVYTSLNLSFEDDKFADESSISLGKDIKITVNDDIPFLGGSEISVDLPTLPLEVYVDADGDGGGKVHVGVNADILNRKQKPEGGWSDNDKKTIETQIGEIKDTMKTLNDYKSGVKKALGKNDMKKLNKVMKEQKESNLPGLDKVKLQFIGYGEGSRNSEGFSTVSLNLFLVADLKGISYTQQFLVWVVPFVINIDAGLKATSSVIGSYDFQKKTFNADWAAKFSPYFEAFGGVGVGKAVGVGAYGNATADIGIQLLGTSKPTGLDTIDLTGELGIKAYFAIFEYKKSFAYKTYHIYSRTKKMPAKASQVKRMNMYDAENYEVQDISYLSGESAWLSGASGGPAKAPAKAPVATVIKPLLTQTYRNSQPQTVSAAGSTVMVYTGADTARDAYNITRVMYSVYDVSSGTWSAPLQVDSNMTADSAPYLWTDGTDIYMIYLDSAKQFGSEDTVESYAAAQNIAIAKFNSQTGEFDPVTTVAASDGGFYSLPKLCMNGGVLTAVWQRSTGDVFGCNSDNSVMCSAFDGQSWSAPARLADGLNSIVDISAYAGDVYYICDGDNDLNTTGDRSLTKLTFGGDSALLDSGTVSSIRLDGGNVYWYSDGTYKKYDGSTATPITSEPIIGATDRFCVVGGQIMFLAATQNASDIYTVAYDASSGEYGEAVKYTDQEKYIDTFSAADMDGQILTVMTRRDVTITEDDVDDKCELAYTLIRDRHDIVVNSVDYDEESVEPGAGLPLRIEVGNAGTSTVNSVDIAITDPDGNVVKSETLTVSIAPGMTEELTVELALDDTISLKKYSVTVTETGNTDADDSNNSYEFKVGYCKLDVTATPIVSGEKHYVIIGIKNVSNVASDGTLNISNSTDPENITKIKFDVLQPDESYFYTLEVSEELLDGSKNVIKVMAESTAEYNELYSHIEHVYCNVDEFKAATPDLTSATISKTTVKRGEYVDLTVVTSTNVNRLRIAKTEADGTLATISYSATASNSDNLTVTDADGIRTWNIRVRFSYAGNDDSQNQTWKLQYRRVSGDKWIDSEYAYDIKVTKYAETVSSVEGKAPYSVISVATPDANVDKGTFAQITVVTTSDASRIRLYVAGKSSTYLKASRNIASVTDNGDGTATWVVNYRFATAGSFTVSAQTRGDKWSTAVDGAAITVV